MQGNSLRQVLLNQRPPFPGPIIDPNWTTQYVPGVGWAMRANPELLTNLVLNPEFTVDTGDYSPVNSTINRVDSAVDPGTTSGGADNWAGKIAVTAGFPTVAVLANPGIVGSWYQADARLYAPSSNTRENVGRIRIANAGDVRGNNTSEDQWNLINVIGRATNTDLGFYILPDLNGAASTIGDVLYADSVKLRALTTAHLFALQQQASLTGVSAPLSIAAGIPAGVGCKITLDANGLVKSGIFARHNGTNMVMEKIVNYVPTVLINTAVAWTEWWNGQIRLPDKDTARLYKGAAGAEVLVGPEQDVSDVPESPWIARFGTGPGSKIGPVSLIQVGVA